ncbi:hypothetical protein ABID46_001562 [Moheibacter stercoris]|uniref:Uncharacterized protein n=1 Tax=Moheibacter stercoris TaxID=1628251 RepID=A0ABV2LTT8_9FLAO
MTYLFSALFADPSSGSHATPTAAFHGNYIIDKT